MPKLVTCVSVAADAGVANVNAAAASVTAAMTTPSILVFSVIVAIPCEKGAWKGT
ncbi:hypothetical protein GAR05_01872 [Micromonospora saelicesensis]|uniref:Uncharacterized protein n=1 Tax=Micromonospora saelicesensis TaxID=285676 RepID=A0ABX9CNI0_9ACTN|nr:hypothetical protein GAR05_01872 [Micromonospora saelicesensis]